MPNIICPLKSYVTGMSVKKGNTLSERSPSTIKSLLTFCFEGVAKPKILLLLFA
jgi:hypothetical protein